MRLIGAVALVLGMSSVALAIDRNCPTGQVWDPSQGLCVAKKSIVHKQKAAKKSADEVYNEALDAISAGEDDKAHDLLKDNCLAYHVSSCNLLGWLNEYRLGDHQRAYNAYELACDAGSAEGCLGEEDILRRGVLGTPDLLGAEEAAEKACKMGDAVGCYDQAIDLEAEPNANPDFVRTTYGYAASQLESQCPARAIACADLGELYRTGSGVEKSMFYALQYYDQACDGGNEWSCEVAAFARTTAQDTDWDVVKGREGFEKACDLGDLNGCAFSAYFYEVGLGVPQDRAAAIPLYAKSCNTTTAAGCSHLAQLADETQLATLGITTADAYQRACEAGDPEGCQWGGDYESARSLALDQGGNAIPSGWYVLGELYRDGLGVDVDLAQAASYFDDACKVYDVQACAAGAELYMPGGGLAKPDTKHAAEMFAVACQGVGDSLGQSCTREEDARTQVNTPTVPLQPNKRGACGCVVGTRADAPFGAFFVLALLLFRRRRA